MYVSIFFRFISKRPSVKNYPTEQYSHCYEYRLYLSLGGGDLQSLVNDHLCCIVCTAKSSMLAVCAADQRCLLYHTIYLCVHLTIYREYLVVLYTFFMTFVQGPLTWPLQIRFSGRPNWKLHLTSMGWCKAKVILAPTFLWRTFYLHSYLYVMDHI